MVKQDDAEAVIPMDRYWELLEYEKLCKADETYLWVWTSNDSGRGLTFGKVETQDKIVEEMKELSDKIRIFSNRLDKNYSKINNLEYENDDLHSTLKSIQSKWWYKLFN